MEQRPLRLGDIVDDYCPRERRLTNHAIVAIVDQAIRQTRCTTCDAEHVYKDGKAPRRKTKSPGQADEPGPGDLAGGQLVARSANAPLESSEEAADVAPPAAAAMPAAAPVAALPVSAEEPDDRDDGRDIWPAHRQLIRATLPRIEGDTPPARPIPEFTMHQRPQGRGGFGYRNTQPWHGGNGAPRGNGFRPERDGNVAPRQGQGQGQGNGQGQGQGFGQGHGGGGGRRRRRHRSR
jgi:hypothetical protein